jgi:hypothetical protein
MKRIETRLVVTLLIALGVPASAATQNAPAASAASGSATVGSGRDSDQAAPAREVFKVGGSVRLRAENRDDFKFGSTDPGNDEQFLLTQLRANATWNPATRVTVFIEIQDARIFGEEGIDQDATPNIFADELDLHQGYVQVDLTPGQLPVHLTVGRQKFNLGAQRLVSSLEWVNTARVWDAVRLDLGRGDERTLNVFASRLVPVNPQKFNGHDLTGNRMFDSYFYGAYFTHSDLALILGQDPGLVRGRLEAYWLFRHQAESGDAVQTFGGRLTAGRGAWDAELEGALQFGKWGNETQRGSMLHTALGYTAADLNDSRFGVAYNFGSGDGDPTDGTHATFDNLYPLNHAFYGYMDFFALQNLQNIEATFNTGFGGGFEARVAYQGFWLVQEGTDAWYNAAARVVRQATQDVGSHVGTEIDITLTRSFWQGRVNVAGGYGHFLTGQYVRDTGPSENADFFYLQAKISG